MCVKQDMGFLVLCAMPKTSPPKGNSPGALQFGRVSDCEAQKDLQDHLKPPLPLISLEIKAQTGAQIDRDS